MKSRTGQYSIAHDRLLVFLVLELEYGILAIALGLPYRQVMSKITTPDEKKFVNFFPNTLIIFTLNSQD